MNLLRSKKGQVGNYIAVLVFLMIFGFTSIFAYYLLTQLVAGFTDAGIYTGIIAETGNKFLSALQMYDNIMVVIMVVMIIGVALSSYKLNTKTAFFIVSLIVAGFYAYVSYFFNYLFIQLVSDAVFTATLLYFPKTLIICTNLHWVGLVIFVIGSIALYARRDTEVDLVQ